MILDMGVDVRYNAPVKSMKALLDEGYDAVFVGSGAPKGKDLDIPGRKEAAANIHIGIDWLESIAFGHIDKIGERVLIIGVGNTAMDCCRTSRRLGGKDIKVMARRPAATSRPRPGSSRTPRRSRSRSSSTTRPSRSWSRTASSRGWCSSGSSGARTTRARPSPDGGRDRLPARRRRHPGHRPGERLPLDRARHRHRVRQVGHAGRRQDDLPEHAARRVLRRRRGLGPGEHHLGGGARPPGGHLHPQPLPGHPADRAARPGDEPHHARRWGIHEWSYSNDYNPAQPPEDEARRPGRALQEAERRGRAGLRRRADRARGRALPQLRHPDGLHRAEVHRVRRLHRRLPGALPDHRARRRGGGAARAPDGAGAEPQAGRSSSRARCRRPGA